MDLIEEKPLLDAGGMKGGRVASEGRAQRHYDEHLGPVYGWMLGDQQAAWDRSRRHFVELEIEPAVGALAVDLGAGNGLQSIPLAEMGFEVFAIDSCEALVQELRQSARNLPVTARVADIMDFAGWPDRPLDLVVCMGDTLTHLPDRTSVRKLVLHCAAALEPAGRLVLSFRDYARSALDGTARFILVRSDSRQVLTCFLEYQEETVQVHDILHVREEGGWRMEVSSYPKLRLDPEWVKGLLSHSGMRPENESMERGMLTLAWRRES